MIVLPASPVEILAASEGSSMVRPLASVVNPVTVWPSITRGSSARLIGVGRGVSGAVYHISAV